MKEGVYSRWYRYCISETLDKDVGIFIDVTQQICWGWHSGSCNVRGYGREEMEIRLRTLIKIGWLMSSALPSNHYLELQSLKYLSCFPEVWN